MYGALPAGDSPPLRVAAAQPVSHIPTLGGITDGGDSLRFSLLPWLGLGLWACGAQALEFRPCQITHPAGIATVAAECTTLSVPESAERPGGHQIELFIARVPAISARKAPDPLFVLAGGPGAAASEFYAAVAPAFARVNRERDIVLVDQRGTGRSNALRCALDDEALLDAGGEGEVIAATRRCLAEVAAHADVREYTTAAAVRDLEAVRGALGLGQIDLYGVSYGTRVAQQYMRHHGAQVRAAILDGVVPPQRILGPRLAIDAEAALGQVLARCNADEACRSAFGDPVVHYRALRTQLESAPAGVLLAAPRTGERVAFEFGAAHFATVLRLSTYSAEQAALLPLALNEAHMHRNFVPLASQYLLMSDTLNDQIAYGMHHSVVCAEDAPWFGAARTDRTALAATFIGTLQLDGLETLCREWPRGVADDDLHQPLGSSVPTLLLSGGADPVTPPADGALAAAGLRHALHVVIDGMGHGQIGAPCVDRLIASFLERGTTEGLDTSCVARVRPMPFFTTLAGPPP
ncbi:MAG: putative hydrolase [Steroidobacteraceae bacterium]